MAGRGAPPGDPNKRKGNDRTFAMTTIDTSASVKKAPPLPKSIRHTESGRIKYVEHRPETKRWYQTWAKSPQGAMFTATDWQRLHMLAPLVDAYFVALAADQAGKAKELMAEIRLNEQKLGATPEDRLRLRWQLEEPDASPASGPQSSSRGRSDPRLQLVEGGNG